MGTVVQFKIDADGGNAVAQLQKLIDAATEAARRQHELAGSATALAVSSKGAAAAAGNLRFQLFDIGQSLAGGMNPLMILSQQGPQVAQALSQASASGATLGQTLKGALGPVAALGPALLVASVVAGTAAVAYQGLTAESERAAEVQAIFVANTKGVGAALNDTTRLLATARLTTSGASEETIAYAAAMGDLERAYAAASVEASALIAANERIINQEIPTSLTEGISAVSAAYGNLAERIDALDGASDVFKFLTLSIDGMTTSTAELQEQSAAAMGAMIQQRAALMLQTAAQQAATKAKKDAAEAERRLAKEEQDAASKRKAAAAAAAAEAKRKEEETRRANEQYRKWLDELAAAERKAAGDAAGAAGLAYVQRRIKNAQDAEDKAAADAAAVIAQRQNTAGAVGTALSSPLSAVSQADPTGIAAAVVAGLQSSAAMEGGSSVFTEAADLIVRALENLPAFLDSALQAVQTIVTEVPVTLIEALPGMVKALAEGIPQVIGALVQLIPDVVIALAQALPAMVPDLILLLGQAIIGAAPMIAIGLATAITDPAFYEAIGEAFVKGIETMFQRLGDIGENLGIGTTQAGGGFQLFDAPSSGASSANGGGATSIIQINPADMWSDFTTWIDTETSKLGRL